MWLCMAKCVAVDNSAWGVMIVHASSIQYTFHIVLIPHWASRPLRGRRWITGATAATGTAGATGVAGATAATGAMAATGAAGATGMAGVTGAWWNPVAKENLCMVLSRSSGAKVHPSISINRCQSVEDKTWFDGNLSQKFAWLDWNISISPKRDTPEKSGWNKAIKHFTNFGENVSNSRVVDEDLSSEGI